MKIATGASMRRTMTTRAAAGGSSASVASSVAASHAAPPTAAKSRALRMTAGVATLALCAACSVDGSSKDGSVGASNASKTVTLVTHDSWAMDKAVMAEFTKKTGYTVVVKKAGDVGEMANKIVLSKGNPEGDVVFGLENTFSSRVAKSGALADYTSKAAAPSAAQYDLPEGQGKAQLTPVDTGAVCVNIDDTWFEKHKIAKPTSLDDLVKPEYKNLFVAEGAASSSAGLGFLVATIGKYGENGWQGYWKKLMANGVKLTKGWEDAWNVDYTAGGNAAHGTRPLVVSYDSSPAAPKQKTSALDDGCFRTNEFAGVLAGAKNPDGAKALIDFMQGTTFQQALPANMYAFPVDSAVSLPKEWSAKAKRATNTVKVTPDEIDSKRSTWLTQWQDITSK